MASGSPSRRMANEDGPLDLVLAIDVSGSMESSLDQVKVAVKRLLSKLRPGDAATLVGFNDTLFLAAEREQDQQARERAVDLLTAWGGTALYDATVRAIDLVSRGLGAEGHRHLLRRRGPEQPHAAREPPPGACRRATRCSTPSDSAAARRCPRCERGLQELRQGHGRPRVLPEERVGPRRRLRRDRGGAGESVRAVVFARRISKHDDRWRTISVQVRGGKYDVRARQGYRLHGPPRPGR